MIRTLRAGWLAGLIAGVVLAGPARAEVWGYVDEMGVAHFAAEKLDERYELYFRGGESSGAARGVVNTARPVAVPTAPRKLVAFFEVSPGYKQVKHHLREASATHGIDMALLQALIATESGFDADALSPKGAVGLMQIIPATAERYGVTGDARTPVRKKLADPKTNIRVGTRYLRDLIKMFPGRLELALAAYNAGEGAVLRAGNRIPNYRETQNYVKTVLQLYGMLKPPSTLGAAGGDRAPQRVRVELAGPASATAGAVGDGKSALTPPLGGGVGRGNLPPGLSAVPAIAVADRSDVKIERD